jgi:hypothetical protein
VPFAGCDRHEPAVDAHAKHCAGCPRQSVLEMVGQCTFSAVLAEHAPRARRQLYPGWPGSLILICLSSRFTAVGCPEARFVAARRRPTPFPACSFSTCRKCMQGSVERYAKTALAVKSAFGGLALIQSATLVDTGAKWSEQSFCAQLHQASPRGGTYILTHLYALLPQDDVGGFCDAVCGLLVVPRGPEGNPGLSNDPSDGAPTSNSISDLK